MKKALFALMLGLVAAPAAWAFCTINDTNCHGWYHNEYLPQQQQRAQQQYVPVRYEERYGAISQSSDGTTWWTNNHPSREAAEARALTGCQERSGQSCKVVWDYANTCMALVRNINNAQLYPASDPSKWKAKRMAMKKCKAESGSPSACTHHAAECSLPVRIN